MSFKDYVHHISQKYRIAVAISVIKSKPNNLTIDEYLLQLQNKIKNQDLDPNETVCSDDFNFDDDDILNDNGEQNLQKDYRSDKLNDNRMDFSTNENDSQCSLTILNDFAFGHGRIEPNVERETTIGDTLRLLKEVSAITHKEPNEIENLSQLTFCESQDAGNNHDDVTHFETNTNEIQKNIIRNNIDSQETQLYTLHGFTQDYTHVSQTQSEYFVIADKYIRNKANGDNTQVHVKEANKINETDTETFGNVRQMVAENVVTVPNMVTENVLVITNEKAATCLPQHIANVENNFNNTQIFQNQNETEYTVHKDVPNSDKGRKDTRNISDEIEIANVHDTQTIIINMEKELARDMYAANRTLRTNTNNDKNTCKGAHEMNMNTNKNLKDINVTNCTPLLSFDSQKIHNATHKEPSIEHVNDKLKNIKETDKHIQSNQLNENPEIDQQENDDIENDNDNMDIDETGSDENTQEKVPFKVIEELNRVKNFVNKKNRKYDGCSTDSGYRSDSQVRSSLKTLSQQSGAWLNQSAHCLFNHILQATATDHIVKEIAQVLGKLIDKLHEDENYPPFLEDLLATVDSLLLDIRTGGDWRADLLITKEETTHRLLLLNKSKHILKYSIEKITIILEELHTNLTQENLYELTNIVEMENICYIFQVLETLLKRYMKVKDMSSTQNSQEETFPTRSSLTELWRKKWYPNSTKEIKIENKTCVLKRCGEVLNKIIVGCMDGYSLVVFAALQCFNLMQV